MTAWTRPPRRPPQPPAYPGPAPRLRPSGYVSAEHGITIDAPPGLVHEILGDPDLALEDVVDFEGRFPAVVSTEPLIGAWGRERRAGDRRRVRFADGHYLAEQVVVDDPDRFRYLIWGFTSAQRFALRHGVAEFRYLPEGPGTRVIWTYSLLPTSPLLAPVIRGFVRRTLSPMMTTTLSGMRTLVQTRMR